MTDEAAIVAVMMDACPWMTTMEAYAILESCEKRGWTIYRKKVSRTERRPTVSQPMTDKLRKMLRAVHRSNPDLTQQKIAEMFNVNIGRVSEALQ